MAYPSVIYNPPESLPYETDPAITTLTQRKYPLGMQLVFADGRKFRYAMNGAGTLVVGNALTGIVSLSTDEDNTCAAGAIGDKLITFTHGAATVAANYFAEGYAVISVTPGGGDTYRISHHLALTSSTAGDIVNLMPGHTLRRALTTTSRMDLVNHPYSRVIQSPATTVAAVPVGVAVSAPTTLLYCWVQTAGVCGVLTSGTAIGGDVVGTGLGTAGAVGPIAALATQPIFGTVVVVGATAAWSTIMLTID